MVARDRHADPSAARPSRFAETVHRAFHEFLKLPLLIVAGFIGLSAATSYLDRAQLRWLESARAVLRDLFLDDSQATRDLLATIAGSVITVTSITFSLLLLAVQQAAAVLTDEVYDQFLRRRINQGFFGLFVGLAVYALVVLGTVNDQHNPVFGAALALLLTIVSLLLMILLLYTTIDQMRPAIVIDAIHDYALWARERQCVWLCKVRSSPAPARPTFAIPVPAPTHGYVARLDVDALGQAAAGIGARAEIVLHVSIGAYVAFHDTVAEVRADDSRDATEMASAVQRLLLIEEQRDLDTDPAYGIEQLAIIGWTCISTAKSNPEPGLLVIRSLRDLLARWSEHEARHRADGSAVDTAAKLVVVYADDLLAQLLEAFETLMVVASESMQSQTAAEIFLALAVLFDRLPAAQQQRVEDLIRRSLSALGEHVLTAELDAAICRLVGTLDRCARAETADLVRSAHEALRASIGKLGSRATRVKSASR